MYPKRLQLLQSSPHQSPPHEDDPEQRASYYLDMLEGLNVGYTELDLTGRVTFYDSRIETMNSRPREEFIGLHYKRFMDEKTAGEAYRVFHEVYVTGVPRNRFVKELIRKDGSRMVTEGCVSALKNREGRIIGFREIWVDITHWKKTEEELADSRLRLEAIFRSVGDAIIAVDKDGRILDANKAMENLCDLPVGETVGTSFKACATRCNKACHPIIAETLDRKTGVTERRIQCGRLARPLQTVAVTSSPLLDPQEGKFIGAVLVIRDMTRLVGLENELRGKHPYHDIVGQSKKMQEIYGLIDALADMDTTVLITGKSGTGKELVAKAIHDGGIRSSKPFVTVNCSALAENLLESELFGHVKGAFTGAFRDKQGRFQMADGGTILLDEIGDISPMIQLKLLRVLQEKSFERVGDCVPQKVDVRVIACTNRDLKEKVERGEFREDIYYRLKVVEIALPPLNERLEDLPFLVEHFRVLFNERFQKNIKTVSTEVMNRFLAYPWPGNVRELEHAIERAFVLCTGHQITVNHLAPEIRDYRKSGGPVLKAPCSESTRRQDILEALRRARWNKARAAGLLGIHRRTLYRQMDRFAIDPLE